MFLLSFITLNREVLTATTTARLAPPWWFLPTFIAVGQVLMRTTGYTAWAAQAGQEFMLTFMFYMAMLGPLSAGWLYARLRKTSAVEAKT